MSLKKLIRLLTTNIDPCYIKNREIDLIISGGAFNVSYLVGCLYFIHEMRKKGLIVINKISTCSASSLIGLLFLIDKVDLFVDTLYELSINSFKKNKHVIFDEESLANIINIIEKQLPENILSIVNERLYITYYDVLECKQIIKNNYTDVNDIFNTIKRSCFIPYITMDKLSDTLVLNCEIYKLTDDHCGAYSSFEGSPASKGILQFDMWNVKPSGYDWDKLKDSIKKYGLRNSLLVAPMPTASTSQILGYNECFEPLTSNIYSRSTLAGEFIVANRFLMKELIHLGLWNEQLKNNIIANKGSIQHLDMIPENIRNKYKIVWEIPMKHVIDMSADRGAFVCQSQSLNLWVEEPTYNSLTSMHFYSWKKGLKTGIYYLRRKAKHQAQQFSIEPEKNTSNNNMENDICEMCSA